MKDIRYHNRNVGLKSRRGVFWGYKTLRRAEILKIKELLALSVLTVTSCVSLREWRIERTVEIRLYDE